MSAKSKQIFEMMLWCLLAALVRAPVLLDAAIESDEAIVGLMGKHVLEGATWPIFYYGQAYMGSLEPLLAALSFSLFGISNIALKTIPFIFAIACVPLIFGFTKYLSNTWAARFASLYFAIAPNPLILWSSKARGGFIETVFLGTAALYICSRLLSNKKSFSPALVTALGLIVGLAWWTNNQIVFYVLPIALCIIHLLCHLGAKDIGKIISVGLISFFIGSAPFWWFNIAYRPRWQTFEVLFGKSAGGHALEYFFFVLEHGSANDSWCSAFLGKC